MHTCQTPHEKITKIRKEISPATSELLDRCLAKRPSERYVDATALLEALSVCREALTQPQITQRSAIKRITMVLEKSSEVGKKVMGTDSRVPSAVEFADELAKVQQAGVAKKKSGVMPLPKPAAAPPPAGEAPAAPAPKAPAAPAAPAAAASRAPAAPARAEQPRSSFMKLVVGGVLVGVVLAVVAIVFLRSSGPSPEDIEKHLKYIRSARESALKDPEASTMFLDQARKLKITDRQWRRREEAVESLIQACQLYLHNANPAAIETMLDDIEKVFPGDETIKELRKKLKR
jgi:hypothetical protein